MELKRESGLRQRRVWKRQWRYKKLDPVYKIYLPFEIRPSVWPDIEIHPVSEKEFAYETGRYEFEITIDAGTSKRIWLDIFGERFCWDAVMNRLSADGGSVAVIQDDGMIKIHIYMTDSRYEVAGDEESLCCDRKRRGHREISVTAESGTAGSFEGRIEGWLADLTVYGIRRADYSEEILREISGIKEQGIIYQEPGYQIWTNRLSDKAYGSPDAFVPDPYTVISAQRVTEEFEWRHTPMGDMTRCIDRSDIWRGRKYEYYPEIVTGTASVDAAYHVALNVLHDACYGKYSLKGEEGMWSGGAFQGPGMGFGVWKRDTMQILLRGGALWDRDASARTLEYIMRSGKDNAVDGIPAPVIACRDYYLATHDLGLIAEVWRSIREKIEEAERHYDPVRHLIRAGYSSANDAFEDPDAGGYALSTEIYCMDAYRTAARFAEIFEPGLKERYRERANELLEAIRARYWNPSYGFFTSGPKGSRGFGRGIWETCGVEASVLSRFQVTDRQQKQSCIRVLKEKIITPYGIPLMPTHKEKNHLTQAAWPVYNTGFAEAASEIGDQRLLMRLIAQQIRNAVFQKTFYEVLDTQTGENWRWPGQTWHAMGYISMLLYGVLGIRIEEKGITFLPCVPEPLRGIRLEGLRYCGMSLRVVTEGTGQGERILLDGKCQKWIPWNLTGGHEVRLICGNREE